MGSRNTVIFKATLALVALYVAIAAALLAAILLAPAGIGAFLARDAVGFTVVLVAGMVLVAAYLAYNVAVYNPALLFVHVPPTACPDYYEQKIDRTGNADADHVVSCVSKLYTAPVTFSRATPTAAAPTALLQALADDPTTADTATCATFYPALLVRNESSPYTLRQKFSAACKVPWTDNAGNFAVLASQDAPLN